MKKFLIALSLFFSGSLFAYGPAGCGVGALIFKDNNAWWAQILAGTTNGTLGNQTFGITSGTLECDSVPLIDLSHVEDFIDSNKNSVANELARGKGDTVTVLGYAFQCKDNAPLATALRSNYSNIYKNPTNTSHEIASRINTIAESVQGCSSI